MASPLPHRSTMSTSARSSAATDDNNVDRVALPSPPRSASTHKAYHSTSTLFDTDKRMSASTTRDTGVSSDVTHVSPSLLPSLILFVALLSGFLATQHVNSQQLNVIHLPRDTQRWDRFLTEIQTKGLAVDEIFRLDAVDGRALSASDLEEQAPVSFAPREPSAATFPIADSGSRL